MGNARKPDNVLRLKGTYRKDRHGDPKNKVEFNEVVDMIPPGKLSAEAKRRWSQLLKQCEGSGLITEVDYIMLAALCQQWSRFLDDPDAFTAAQLAQLKSYCHSFGFSPVERGKLQIPSTGVKKVSRFHYNGGK